MIRLWCRLAVMLLAALAFTYLHSDAVPRAVTRQLTMPPPRQLEKPIAGNVSDVPMRWVLQNETQTDGLAYPPPHSSSTMQIRYVAYYRWAG